MALDAIDAGSNEAVGETDTGRLAAALGEAEAGRVLFEAALVNAVDAVLIAQLDEDPRRGSRVVFVNAAFTSVTGYTAQEAMGQRPLPLLRGSLFRADDMMAIGVTAYHGLQVRDEIELEQPDGTPYWAEVQVVPLDIGSAGRTSHVLGTIRDISQRRFTDDQLAHLAAHDSLTGLPNRNRLLDGLDQALDRHVATDEPVSVLFVDLDHFKLVNDSFGHQAGDHVLRQFADRLGRAVPDGDLVGRFGGDEFVVIHNGTAAGSAVHVAEQILRVMEAPFDAAGHEMVLSVSIGLASAAHAGDGSEALRNADTALYAAKERGRQRLEVFSSEQHVRVVQRVEMEAELRTALRDDQFLLQYQPQVDMHTGRMVGVEGLIRWQHPERGLVPPGDFIPVAEDSGLIVPIGRWVVQEACRQISEWRTTTRHPPPSVTINVSSLQLGDPGFVDDVRDALAAHEVPPRSLCLELTESALMGGTTDALDVLNRLRDLGVYIAIDDFGTGYSSLSRLRDLPVEVLKIDRSFVSGLHGEGGDVAVIASILSLAIAMGLHVIAEGVEQQDQATMLVDLGCSVAQGFLYARPQAADDITFLAGRALGRERRRAADLATEVPGADRSRRGRRRFVDEFMYQLGLPMDDAPAGESLAGESGVGVP